MDIDLGVDKNEFESDTSKGGFSWGDLPCLVYCRAMAGSIEGPCLVYCRAMAGSIEGPRRVLDPMGVNLCLP